MNRTHSLYGGSSAERRIQCPASAIREELASQYTLPEQSQAAADGDTIHDAIDACLSHWEPGKSTDDCVAAGTAPRALNDDHLYVVRYCVDVAVNRLNELVFNDPDCKPKIYTELKAQLSDHPDFWGYADLAVVTDTGFDLFDWKSGRVSVDLRNVYGKLNPSVAFYCKGVLDSDICPAKVEYVNGWIVQPRAGGVDRDEITIDECEAMAAELLHARENPDVAAVGSWCTFCDAKPLCRDYHHHTGEILTMTTKDPAMLKPEELATTLDRLKDIRRWLDDVESFAIYQLQSGVKIGTWGVMPTRAMRYWSDEEAVLQRLQAQSNLSQDDYAPRKVRTPAQMEKLLKDVEALSLDDLIESRSGGVKLVKMED